MDPVRQDLLARMRPDLIAADDAPWQQRKSSDTRVRILEATIDCIVEKGYARLSTNAVTQRAGVSRGAMHHHFPSRMALVGAVIDYNFYQRMRQFLADYFAAAEGADDRIVVEVAAERHWLSVTSRHYSAYIELAVAARTDVELNLHFLPAAQRFDRVWTEQMMQAFPQWQSRWDALRVANDFAVAAHMGLVLQLPAIDDAQRVDAVRALIADVLERLRTDGP